MESLLEIKNVYANAGDKEILKGLSLTINPGEVHVIMGPNGAGKSTLANVIFNNQEYRKVSGEIYLEGENISNTTTDKIARKGVFMSFQSPEIIPLQSYFRLNSPESGQFEHTLIIVDEGASLHFIEGCSAPKYNKVNLHVGCVELYVKDNAYLRYSTIENWSKNMMNLNTKKAIVGKILKSTG